MKPKKKYWLGNIKQESKKTFSYSADLLKDHKIYGEPVLMGVAHLSIVIDYFKALFPDQNISLKRFLFTHALLLRESEEAEVSVQLDETDSMKFKSVYQKLHQDQVVSAKGERVDNAKWQDQYLSIQYLIEQAQVCKAGDEFYSHPADDCYGPSLHSVSQVYILNEGEVLGEVKLTPEMSEQSSDYYIHPAIFDACHVISSFSLGDEPALQHRVPFMIKSVEISQHIQKNELNHCYCKVNKIKMNDQIAEMDLLLCNTQGQILVKMMGLTTKKVPNKEALFSSASESIEHTEKPTFTPLKPIGTDLLDNIIDYLKQKIAVALQKDKDSVSIENNFMDLGLDSNNMIGAVREIEQELSIELYPTLFFEYQNILSLSKYFLSENQESFVKLFNLPEPATLERAFTVPTKQTKSSIHLKHTQDDDIAIIGMGGYLPQSHSIDDFWKHLENATDLIQEIPSHHWDYRPWFSDDKNEINKTYSKWGSFIEGVDQFDYSFFGISKRQADWIDPQLRLFLQSVQHTLEDAGIINQIKGSNTGVFVGCCFQEYWDEIIRKKTSFVDYQAHSAAMSSLTGLVSYIYDLQGASIPLDNACASSLTALHLACQAIKNKEVDQAIVGGVNLLLSPLHYVYFSKIQALSPTGRCHTFDQKADGYVPGEGVLSVLIKPLAQALKEGHPIHAVIKSTGINHVGRSNNPYAPRPELQIKLLQETWKKAKINPEQITYLEAHGTGTKLGDPIEVNALKAAFKPFTQKQSFCALGSAKAHLGHLEGAAGLASLIKVILMMKNKKIPKMPNFEELNSYIKLEDSPFYVNTELKSWQTQSDNPRMAGISSFGMTGNNAHVVIEEYIAPELPHGTASFSPFHIIPFSAKTEKQLKEYVAKLNEYLCHLKIDDQILIRNIAYTLQLGRQAMDSRVAFSVKDIHELITTINHYLNGEINSSHCILPKIEPDHQDIAQSWVNGKAVDWKNQIKHDGATFISLPVYPFAGERCWMSDEINEPQRFTLTSHVSQLDRYHYQGYFHQNEFILAEHIIDQKKMLPGAAYIDLASHAARGIQPDSSFSINHLVFLAPIVCLDDSVAVDIRLHLKEGKYFFEVACRDTPKKINATGFIEFLNQTHGEEKVNINQLKQDSRFTLAHEKIYQMFSDQQIHYGKHFKCITEFWVNGNESLAEFHLPPSETQNTFVIHPSVMDAAFQSIIGLNAKLTLENPSPSLPFAVTKIHQLTKIPEHGFIYTKLSPESSGTVKKYDILICGQEGNVCCVIQSFTTRELVNKRAETSSLDSKQSIQQFLTTSTCKILNVSEKDIFFDEEVSAFGMDSITLTELANVVNQQYSLNIMPTIFFEYPTLNNFRDYLMTQIKDDRLPTHVVDVEKLPVEIEQDFSPADVAIIGISGTFPRASNVAEFWQNLIQEFDCITKAPSDRIDFISIDEKFKKGGFIDCVHEFDPAFFGISPAEAEYMDPQQRLLMQFACAAVYDAGYALKSLWGSQTSVFIGTASTGYQQRVFNHVPVEGYTASAITPSIGSSRISYFLNLHGPSEPIETACSSSLVAIHRGVESIKSGLCQYAIVGGVNTLLSSEAHLSFAKAGMLSPEGKCKTFSSNADGYVRGEGVGILLLKRLDLAEKDHDHIYAVIKASAENHGGRANSLTAPNANAQAELIKQAYRAAKVPINSITYIETHGTGTPIGDPVEINGLKKAFSELSQEQQSVESHPYCGLGSVKTNIGHLELAAGVAGLIKVLLAMKYQTLPKSLYSEQVNEYIQLEQSPFYLIQKTQPWKRIKTKEGKEWPRRAGVSSFGFGGVNAHIVLEEYIENVALENKVEDKIHIVPVSAKTKEQAIESIHQLQQFLSQHKTEIQLKNLAYTLQVGRDHYEYRAVFYAKNIDGLIADLNKAAVNEIEHESNQIQSDLFSLSEQEIGKLWCQGHTIPWEQFYSEHKPYRMSLPTYAFAKESYWISNLSEFKHHPPVQNLISEPIQQHSQTNDFELKKYTVSYLKRSLAESLKIKLEKINENAKMENLGIDSIMVLKLTGMLEEQFGVLPKTLFFEYQTLLELSDYLIKHHHAKLTQILNIQQPVKSLEVMHSVLLPQASRFIPMASKSATMDIAIIGLSGRYPQSPTLSDFWHHLKTGKNCITTIPPTYWNMYDYESSIKSKWGGFIEGVDEFDPLFFNISPREAELMDPQERLFLQSAWHALEDSGYTRESLKNSKIAGNVGVYVGVMYEEYPLYGAPMLQGVGGNPASIANRVSYVCDFNGPSMALDTMCSSSLTTIHLACQALKAGHCQMAIAGGVNISIHPNKYILLSQNNFISSQGRCESFGKGGDGYIPGEGVGCVVLKPLATAIEDRDHIYAVIKGSAINHGGKTNGYTVPNPNAQAHVVQQALAEAKVNPRHVSYVEAHGTGTQLGDPIEIAGLTRAYEEAQERQYCAIGSAKSNIGHCESAAGIAGVTKVLLQMQHQELVPSIHAEELNPHIDFTATPFKVQRELTSWNRPVINGIEYPRVAGVSSFGAGGSNAHVVVEEYVDMRGESITEGPYLMVLSAKTPESLKSYAELLLKFVKENQAVSLSDLAYTLQIGREAMEYRMAFLTYDHKTFCDHLQKIAEDQHTSIQHYYFGNTLQFNPSMDLLGQDEDFSQLVNIWVGKRKFEKLSELWVQGYPIEWKQLYTSTPMPKRISLPTYPFAKERYWVDGVKHEKDVQKLHPLIDKNISTLASQAFETTFYSHELFLRDHVINTTPVLPGVCHIEMARAAVTLSTAGLIGVFKNITWTRPIRVTQSTTVMIHLHPLSSDEIVYEIKDNTGLIFSEGHVILASIESSKFVDLSAIESRCTKNLTPDSLYAQYHKMGIHYGESFKTIQKVIFNEQESLSEISTTENNGYFEFNPVLVDAALHSILALRSEKINHSTLYLPYSIEEIQCLSPLSNKVYAHAQRKSSGSQNETQRYDFDLINEQGQVCVALKGLSIRAVQSRLEPEDLVLAQALWQPSLPAIQDALTNIEVVLFDSLGELKDKISELSIHTIASSSIEQCFISAFDHVQLILKEKLTHQKHIWFLVLDNQVEHYYASLAGLLKTARRENPNFIGKLISIADKTQMVEIINREKTVADNAVEVRYDAKGQRSIKQFKELHFRKSARSVIKEHGVYWLTGGLGGLGLIFADYLSTFSHITLILSGRSALNESAKTILSMLRNKGMAVEYVCCDVSDLSAVLETVQTIKTQYGHLNGVFHSAGVIRDAFILKKKHQEIESVLRPKITGVLNLDKALQNENIDFIVLFSSLAGQFGSLGQADYAGANAFLDAYAHDYNQLAAQGLRQGRMAAIDWPLWKSGGMQIDAASLARITRETGLVAMETEIGLSAFEQVMQLSDSHCLVMQGNPEVIRKQLLFHEGPVLDNAPINLDTVDAQLLDKTDQYLKGKVAVILKMPINRLKSDVTLDQYGIDSVMILELTSVLEEQFGVLPKTLFFEYQTLLELSDYLIKHHHAKLTQILNIQQPVKSLEVMHSVLLPQASRFIPMASKSATMDIAIIGLSGRYPQSPTLSDFWHHLKTGKNCITTIPPTYWNMYDYESSIKSKWGGFIEGVDEFDPLFFNISPREAELMDPQERLFLQSAWHALEDSGYTRESLKNSKIAGNVGVYVGVMYEEYPLYGAPMLQGVGGNPASIANRVSYVCDFNGPSMALDTMCSSSLTTIHLACQALKAGHCQMAIAGGVNISIHPNKYILLSQNNFISSQGRCESFGKGGDGYIPGEGVGCVVLKPLATAIEDRDHIYAVIKGSAINHGGKTNGYTVPNPNAQAHVVQQALAEAKVNPRHVSYVEAHGTGTQLGDPIEIAGLTRAYEEAQERQYCAIGSAKSNIGHCESAAGIAGVTKVLLQMQHQELVPSIHAEELNPHIDFTATPFKVQRELTSWNRPVINGIEYPRVAGVSSFGAGGSNAHVVVEEYVDMRGESITEGPYLMVLSAKTPESLKSYAELLLKFVKENQAVSLSDLAYTLQIGREAYKHRLALIIDEVPQLLQGLQHWIENKADESKFLYCGQVHEHDDNIEFLNHDSEMKGVIEKWEMNRNFDKLASFWTKGLRINWNNLYQNSSTPKRISLPAYPFSKGKYWVTKPIEISKVPVMPQKVSHDQISGEWISSELPQENDWINQIKNKQNTNIIFIYYDAAEFNILSDLINDINSVLFDAAQVRLSFKACLWSETTSLLGQGEAAGSVFIMKQSSVSLEETHQLMNQLTQLDKLDIYLMTELSDASLKSFYPLVYSNIRLKVVGVDNETSPQVKIKILLNEWIKGLEKQKDMNLIKYKDHGRFKYGQIQEKNQAKASFVTIDWVEKSINKNSNVYLNEDAIILINEQTEKIIDLDQLVKRFNKKVTCIHYHDLVNKEAQLTNPSILIDLSDLYSEYKDADTNKINKVLFYQKLIANFTEIYIIHLTRNLRAFKSNSINLAGAKFTGLVKMLSVEYSHVFAKTIDIDDDLININSIMEIIQKDVAKEVEESEIIYRNQVRYVPILREQEITALQLNNHISISQHATYVITGGTSGIGMEFAKYFARLGAKHLILMGVSELPPRNEWSSLVDQEGLPNELKHKLRNLILIENLGTQIDLYTRDLKNQNTAYDFFTQIRNTRPPIKGVIHSAGAMAAMRESEVAFVKKSIDTISRVLSPKQEGLDTLMGLFKKDDLDFFVTFSSTAGMIPCFMKGLSDYGMGNAYLEHIAEYERKRGKKSHYNIYWTGWSDAGSHTHSLVIKNNSEAYAHNLGFIFNNTSEGLQLFNAAITYNAANVLPTFIEIKNFYENKFEIMHVRKSKLRPKTNDSSLTFNELIEGLKNSHPNDYDSFIAKLEIPSLSDDQIIKLGDSLQLNNKDIIESVVHHQDFVHDSDVINQISTELAKVLKINEMDISIHESFQDYGLDSITGTQLSLSLERLLGMEIKPGWLIEHPTVEKFAKYIAKRRNNEHVI